MYFLFDLTEQLHKFPVLNYFNFCINISVMNCKKIRVLFLWVRLLTTLLFKKFYNFLRIQNLIKLVTRSQVAAFLRESTIALGYLLVLNTTGTFLALEFLTKLSFSPCYTALIRFEILAKNRLRITLEAMRAWHGISILLNPIRRIIYADTFEFQNIRKL